MQFSTINSTRLGLVEDTLFLCGLPTLTASYTSYALADITRNLNVHYLDTVGKIWESAGGWQYDDSNATSLPIGTTNLVNNQQDYTIPTDAQKVERIEVMDINGDYQKVTQLDWHDIQEQSMTQYLETAGMPLYYDLVGRSVMFYPTPNSAYATLTSGMRVYFDREPTLFTTASTTASPGFASPYHRILSLGAAIDYVKDKGEQDRLVAMKTRLEKGLSSFYSLRNVERKAQIRPRSKRTWRQYV